MVHSIAPGKEGLVHISRLDVKRTEKVEDVVNVGDSVIVKCIEIDDQGRINLSRRDALIELEGMKPENEIDETPRKPRRNPFLNDLIRILILRELIGGGRPRFPVL